MGIKVAPHTSIERYNGDTTIAETIGVRDCPRPIIVQPIRDGDDGPAYMIMKKYTDANRIRFELVWKKKRRPGSKIMRWLRNLVSCGSDSGLNVHTFWYDYGDSFENSLQSITSDNFTYPSHTWEDTGDKNQRTYAIGSLLSNGGRPIIYIATWNHSFTIVDTNSIGDSVMYPRLPLFIEGN